MKRTGIILRFEQRGKTLGLPGEGTLGALIIEDCVNKEHVSLSTGFTEGQRKDIWERWPKYSRQIVSYSTTPKGATFLTFLHPVDK